MRKHIVNRPDEAALRRILEREQTTPAGLILRLAWLEGLSRDEIGALTWGQVSFEDNRLNLPDRQVPLVAELRSWLWHVYETSAGRCPYVLFSERFGDRIQPESISRLARKALSAGGLSDVRLMDLRHDWIIRRLAELSWPEVARISGVEVVALQARFAGFVTEKKPAPRTVAGQIDEFKLWKVLQAEKDTPAGLALWLTWQLGLQAQEIIALTWEQVGEESLHLPDREVPLTNAVRRLLADARARRGEDPHVILTEQSRKPVDMPRLSRLTRAALIRGGMEDVRLADLRKNEARETEDAILLNAVLERGCISRGDAMELLGVEKTIAYARLRRLIENKRLVRVGGKYYLPGTVVPPEEQVAVVQAYLAQAGTAYRQDLAAELHVAARQCSLILKHMVENGTLAQDGQLYRLPPEKQAE